MLRRFNFVLNWFIAMVHWPARTGCVSSILCRTFRLDWVPQCSVWCLARLARRRTRNSSRPTLLTPPWTLRRRDHAFVAVFDAWCTQRQPSRSTQAARRPTRPKSARSGRWAAQRQCWRWWAALPWQSGQQSVGVCTHSDQWLTLLPKQHVWTLSGTCNQGCQLRRKGEKDSTRHLPVCSTQVPLSHHPLQGGVVRQGGLGGVSDIQLNDITGRSRHS